MHGSMPRRSRQYGAWQAKASFSFYKPMSVTFRLRKRDDGADATEVW